MNCYYRAYIRTADHGDFTGLDRVRIANTFFSRLVGLLGREKISNQEGLLISPCSGVHTIFMRFAIDVVYLDKTYKVIGVSRSVKPNRFRFGPKGTCHVLELADGNVKNTGLYLDQVLVFD